MLGETVCALPAEGNLAVRNETALGRSSNLRGPIMEFEYMLWIVLSILALGVVLGIALHARSSFLERKTIEELAEKCNGICGPYRVVPETNVLPDWIVLDGNLSLGRPNYIKIERKDGKAVVHALGAD